MRLYFQAPGPYNTVMDEPKKDPALQKLLDDIENAPENMLRSLDLQMSPELTRLLERGLIGEGLPPVLRDSKAAKAFQQAFDMIGGVPRLSLWADQNLTKFYTLYSKLMPSTAEIHNKTELKISISWASADRLSYARGDVQDVVPNPEGDPHSDPADGP
jgi:hypothetical protein